MVIINEQHWQPRHRYFGNILLNHFYNEGFRYLAVEAIGENQDSLNNRKYPTQQTGFYTVEPNFGNFIRNALDMGYELIKYDAFGKDREQEFAKNIYNNTLAKNPNAKILVWVGVDHVMENESKSPKMAYYLKTMSNINPLTINQSRGDKYASEMGEDYFAVNIDSTRTNFDVLIYNNIPESEFRINPNVVDKSVNLSSIVENNGKSKEKLILSIYKTTELLKEKFNAIPLASYIVRNKEKLPTIKLPEGSYTFVVRDVNARITKILQKNIKL